MRGEHCIAGASVLSAITIILLVFVNIAQIRPGTVTNGLHFVEVNLEQLGRGIEAANVGGQGGLYATSPQAPLGTAAGARQRYRYGIYGACAYSTSMSGVCNTTFASPFNPYAQISSDIVTTRNLRTAFQNMVAKTPMEDTNYNGMVSRVGSALVFIGSCFAVLGLIFGVLKLRVSFLVASVCSGLSALLLMIGAAMWTAIIARNAQVSQNRVGNNIPVGVVVNAGPALYITWVAFALEALAVIPYVISCCTYRKESKDEGQWR